MEWDESDEITRKAVTHMRKIKILRFFILRMQHSGTSHPGSLAAMQPYAIGVDFIKSKGDLTNVT